MSSSSTQLHERILNKPIDPQLGSPLFQKLPAEIRLEIFTYALTDYPDTEKTYDRSTCYTRPSYMAPLRSDTALLSTCRAIYRECWFRPFLLSDQIHWAVGHDDRAPPGYNFGVQTEKLRNTVAKIKGQLQQTFEIPNLRVFAQMFVLEGGGMASLLGIPDLNPRSVTLTIRHADWWFWESDAPLKFKGDFIYDVSKVLPPSVRELKIELESLQRKKYQVDEIARQMMEKWFFRRTDRVVLLASHKEESRWRGTSRWSDKRWIRDETSRGVIDYYVVTVTFLPEFVLEKQHVEVSQIARQHASSVVPLISEKLMLQKEGWVALTTEIPAVLEPRPMPDSIVVRADAPEMDDASGRPTRPRWVFLKPRSILRRFGRNN